MLRKSKQSIITLRIFFPIRSLSSTSARRSEQEKFESKLKNKINNNQVGQRTQSEIESRIQLAAAYRLTHMFGWGELIYNHLTCRLDDIPGSPERFLINPYGYGFDEVTASNLVTIDVEGNVLDSGSGSGKVNPAGFIIHSAVHSARQDAKCVIHCHQSDVVAIGSRPSGLLPIGQAYYALGEITTHEYEGLALLEEEKKSLVKDLGSKSKVMMLKNHGCLTLGSTIPEAFIKLYFLIRACEQQVKAGPDAKIPRNHIQELATEQAINFNSEGFGTLEFAYLQRVLERSQGTTYKS